LKNALRIAGGVVLIAGIALVARAMPPMTCSSVQSLGDQGYAIPLAIGLYATAIVVGVPRWMVIAASGLTFGAMRGIVFAQLGAWVGACLCFLIARTLAKEPVERFLLRQKWYAKITPLFADPKRALWICTLLRVNPILHFTGVGYAAGLAPMGLVPYAVGTFIGMLPMTLFVGWAGDTVGCALLDGREIPSQSWIQIVSAIVVMTLVSVAPLIASALKKKKSLA